MKNQYWSTEMQRTTKIDKIMKFEQFLADLYRCVMLGPGFVWSWGGSIVQEHQNCWQHTQQKSDAKHNATNHLQVEGIAALLLKVETKSKSSS